MEKVRPPHIKSSEKWSCAGLIMLCGVNSHTVQINSHLVIRVAMDVILSGDKSVLGIVWQDVLRHYHQQLLV